MRICALPRALPDARGRTNPSLRRDAGPYACAGVVTSYLISPPAGRRRRAGGGDEQKLKRAAPRARAPTRAPPLL
ncbi:hypothetical protein EVAR_104001_1 [Eumeta japonica]|uniref:Uncharacterized protein n=1 Tax=Eumeta variegata TaxID=151549 RepID=A0A4C1XVS5_EUMVA|nr:hypothetical protein EVAR_104001_1 [Eumeta japonica]